MFKKLLGAAFILVLSLGIVTGAEFKGKVTKVEGTQVTVKNKTEEKTFDIKDAKIQKKEGDNTIAADTSAVTKGVMAAINYDDNNKVSEVTILAKKKK